MPRFFVSPMRALRLALALAVLSPALAETKSPLLGKTRDQVVAQLGEPKSNIRAGAREMLFFAKVKLTLRNDLVIETEDLPDGVPPTTKHPAEAAAATSEQAASQSSATSAGSASVQPEAASSADTNTAASAAKSSDGPSKPTKPPEQALSIKFIKSGSGNTKAAAQAPAAPVATPAPIAAKPVAPAVVPAVAPDSKKVPVVTAAATGTPVSAVATPANAESSKAVKSVEVAAEPVAPVVEESTVKPNVDQKKKASILAKLRNRWRVRRDIETEDNTVEIISGRSYVFAAIVIVGGIAFVWWRYGQRKLALEASAVSHSPFAPPASVDPSAMFSAEQISKLGQKKFEQLVAAYYMKTGVVAERTNAEATAPVHIKIFWKGEQKPFAGVQCHANPPALIPAKPLESLFEALAATDIRRGYVVTTGKFSVEARDFAAEKVFTLLSGDLFMEKLNALPPAARAELLKETNGEEPSATA